MKPQEYTIQSIKKGDKWQGSYGEFQNYALALTNFGEPVKLSRATDTLTDDPQVGEVLYGRLLEESGKNNRTYYILKEEPREPKNRQETLTYADIGVRCALNVWMAQGCLVEAYDNIELEAVHFAKMIERVRNSIK